MEYLWKLNALMLACLVLRGGREFHYLFHEIIKGKEGIKNGKGSG
jgi:hypothetical protein